MTDCTGAAHNVLSDNAAYLEELTDEGELGTFKF